MCGIVVGLSFGKLNKRDEDIRQRLIRFFTTELIIATEERGKDATGAAVLFDDGKYYGLKRGEPSADYLAVFGENRERYGSLLKIWREHTAHSRVYLGHCRAGTIGDKEDNENNHPIKIGNLVGIHNGIIRNHKEIIKNLGCKRDGEVDSEAIFRLFDHYTNKGKEPFTLDMIQEVVNRLDGQFAVTMFNADNLHQVPIFRDGRPVEFILLKRFGILLIVSELKFWKRIHYRYERLAHYYPELNSIKLPVFLGKSEVEVKVLSDDSAMIFDLTKKVTTDTKIDDLGEWKKMGRNDKIWKAAAAATTYGYNYSRSNYSATSMVKKDDKTVEPKRRVFDRITRQYEIKGGDKELNDDKSATIEVDKEINKATTSMTVLNKTALPAKVEEDGAEQKESKSTVKLDDKTDYKKATKDVVEVDPKDITVTEVDMVQYPQEVVKAAKEAYANLPDAIKGYADMEDLISAVDIKDEETAEKLGMVVAANRAFKINWQDGFMAGITTAIEADDSDRGVHKAKQRESHIAGLKSMILLLSKYYDSTKSNNNSLTFNAAVERRLANVVRNSKIDLDMEAVSKLFNTHEQEVIADVGKVMGEATK